MRIRFRTTLSVRIVGAKLYGELTAHKLLLHTEFQKWATCGWLHEARWAGLS